MATVLDIPTRDRFAALAGDWDDLHRAAGGGPFSSHDWLMAWWDAFDGPGVTPRVLVVREAADGPLLAALPLALRQSPVSARLPRLEVPALTPLSVERVGFHDLLARPGAADAARALAGAVVAARDWQLLDLSPFRTSEAFDAFSDGLAAEGLRVACREEIRSVIVAFPDGWEAYAAARSGNFRKQRRSTERRLAEAGAELQVTRGTDPDGDRAILADALDLSARCWKAQAGTDLATDPATRRFVEALWDRLGPKGRMRIHLLKIGGRGAASFYSLLDERIDHALVNDFDEAFRNYSVGQHLICEAMKDSADAGRVEMNMLRRTPLLERFSDRTEPYMRLRAYRRIGLPAAILTAEAALRPLGRNRRRKARAEKRRAAYRGSRGSAG